MDYQTIYKIKESEKATVELAALEGHSGPVVIKRLRGGNPEIYRLLCTVQNLHIPKVFACEQQGDELAIAEEYVDGENLAEYLEKNHVNDKEKLALALQLCEAVKFLHDMEPPMLHRDIKPSNILITGKGVVKLIDFDASRQYKEDNDSDTRHLGTVAYAPPEQFGYSQTDVRSDIYSMGVVFHELRPENKNLAEQWDKVCEKCTSFDPKNRYQSVEELKKDITELLSGKRFVHNICKKVAVVAAFGMMVGGIFALTERSKQIETTGQPTLQPTIPATIAPTKQPEATPTEIPEEDISIGVLKNCSGDFYAGYPMDIKVMLQDTVSCEINGLYFRFTEPLVWAEFAELERLQSWCYNIAEDGKSMLIKKEYLKELYSDTGSISFVISCDDGNMQEFCVNLLEGMPDNVSDLPKQEAEPVVTATPVPTTMLYPDIETVPTRIFYSYYQSYDVDFIIPNDTYTKYDVMNYATCYCYQTGDSVVIPGEMLEAQEGYVQISEQFMMSLEPMVYEFSFYFSNVFGTEQVYKRTVKVYSKEISQTSVGSKLIKSEHTVYAKYPGMVSNMIRNGENSRIKTVSLLLWNGATEESKPVYFELKSHGQVILVPGEDLWMHHNQGMEVTLCITFDDDTTEKMKIGFAEGYPNNPIFTEKYLEILNRADVYYLNLQEETNQLFGHNIENPELVRAIQYCHATGQMQEIPNEMIEVGTGYICISKEYMRQLEPLAYTFTFTMNQNEDLGRHVLVTQNTIKVIDEEKIRDYFRSVSRELSADMVGISGIVNAIFMKKVIGVSVLSEDNVVKQLEPEWYTIAGEGRYVLVKKEWFAKYSAGEQVTLVFCFDNGVEQKLTVTVRE